LFDSLISQPRSPAPPGRGFFICPFGSYGACLFLSEKGMITDEIIKKRFPVEVLSQEGHKIKDLQEMAAHEFGLEPLLGGSMKYLKGHFNVQVSGTAAV
jgi:hypothetical protein